MKRRTIRYSKDEFFAFFLSSVIWFTPFRNLLIEAGNFLLPGSGRLFSLISIAVFFAYIVYPLIHYVRLTQDGICLFLFICLQWVRSLVFHMDLAGDWVSLLIDFFIQIFPYFVIARITVNWEIVKEKLYSSGIFAVFIMLGITGIRLMGGSLFGEKKVYQLFWAFLIGRASIILLLAFFDTKKIKYALYCGVSIILILLYGARTPLVCIVFTAGVYAISAVAHRRRGKKKSSEKGVMKILFPILLVLIAGTVWIRNLSNLTMDDIAPGQRIMWQIINGRFWMSQGRVEIFKAAVDIIGEHMLCGTGLLADRLAITEVLGYPIESFAGTYAHNIALEMVMEFGIFIGAMVIIGLVMICWKGVFLTRDRDKRMIYLYAIGFGIGTLIISNTAMECPELWILLGMGMQRRRREKAGDEAKISENCF